MSWLPGYLSAILNNEVIDWQSIQSEFLIDWDYPIEFLID